jgi:hypothetical protein
MNKLLVMVLCVFSFTLVRAQSLDPIIYTNTLKKNKWILVNKRLIGFDEVSKDDVYRLDTVFISFDNSKMHTMEHLNEENPITGQKIDEILKVDHTYYLTNEIPNNFEQSKIGKTSSGKYIVLHNVSSRYSDDGHYVVWEATVNDNSKIELTLRKSHKRLDMLGRKLVIMKKE